MSSVQASASTSSTAVASSTPEPTPDSRNDRHNQDAEHQHENAPALRKLRRASVIRTSKGQLSPDAEQALAGFGFNGSSDGTRTRGKNGDDNVLGLSNVESSGNTTTIVRRRTIGATIKKKWREVRESAGNIQVTVVGAGSSSTTRRITPGPSPNSSPNRPLAPLSISPSTSTTTSVTSPLTTALTTPVVSNSLQIPNTNLNIPLPSPNSKTRSASLTRPSRDDGSQSRGSNSGSGTVVLGTSTDSGAGAGKGKKRHAKSFSESSSSSHTRSLSPFRLNLKLPVPGNISPRMSPSARLRALALESPFDEPTSNLTSSSQLTGDSGRKKMTGSAKDEMDAGDSEAKVPSLLRQGVLMYKVSAKKQKTLLFKLDPDEGCIVWESKLNKTKHVAIENIKELRIGAEARYYREQFQISDSYSSRWLTIIYILDGRYKSLHLIATTPESFELWTSTLQRLFGVRRELMSGLGHLEKRQAVWERRYWKGADEGTDQRLGVEEVERLCRRLNVNFSKVDLERRFMEADVDKKGYLTFPDFQRFVKLIKVRPELTRLYKKLCVSASGGVFDFAVFESFMRDCQKSNMKLDELQKLFDRFASADSALTQTENQQTGLDTDASNTSSQPRILTLDGFTSFLLSQDNSVFSDQHGHVWQDMTKPLSDYYISSSHNTYLVGHQLVGVSTVEGYIRALLHSCRSVELDIYDGDTEPMIFHGKTLTSKVALRAICEAIAKYAFVTSPYPIIISAEIHCSLGQQELVAGIMREVFGEALVTATIDGCRKIEVLPSPEELKGRVLLKAKNLYVAENEALREKSLSVDTESSTSETSASDTEMLQQEFKELKQELKHELQRARQVEPIKELKGEISKARHMVNRVRGHISPPSSPRSQALPLPRSSSVSPRPNTIALPQTDRLDANTTTALVTSTSTSTPPTKVKMSLALVALLVYTVGVKCRGFNKKEHYATEHVFSLSERTANKILKQSMMDLVKHNRNHVVRIYPNGTRLKSTNFEPHRYWASGAQLVAINWQTFDLGYMINHAMFQRNGRSGYVLKPKALRQPSKETLGRRTEHFLDIKIISAQQLPRPKDSFGREIFTNPIVDPYIEISIYIPDWTHSPFLPPSSPPATATYIPARDTNTSVMPTTARVVTFRTSVVKNNGFNPVWEEKLSLPFDCVGAEVIDLESGGGMRDLIFVKFAVMDEHSSEPLALYCVSLGSLQEGYRHLPLHDSQLSQYLFSTLFVKIGIRDARA